MPANVLKVAGLQWANVNLITPVQALDLTSLTFTRESCNLRNWQLLNCWGMNLYSFIDKNVY